MRSIEVCLSPELIHQYDLKKKMVVVVDIFRATSCMVTGLSHGVNSFKVVGEVEKCKKLKKEGYLTAGERNGIKVDEFDMGNSPFEYQNKWIQNKKVAISTTNGSQAILKSQPAGEVIIGAFLNLNEVVTYLLQNSKDVVIHCAGWKGAINLEDTLFAGTVIDECGVEIQPKGDSALIAHQLYINCHENLLETAQKSNHAYRLSSLGNTKDLEFCMTQNVYQVLPKLIDKDIVC